MLKQTLSLAIMATFIAGCAQTVPQGPKPIDAATLNASLSNQQTSIIDSVTQGCQAQSAAVDSLSLKIDGLNQQLQQLKTAPTEKVVTVPTQCAASPIGDKFLLGEVESVLIDELNTSFASRIDTGAESSSLDASNIVLFERDGTQWVRFDVHTQGADKPPQTFESKVVRFVRIKQDADEKDDRRPVIHAHLKIGKYAAETDLNLTDRSHLEYPLLLGRKFMKDIAVVDVGQSYVHGKAKNLVTSSSK